MRKQILSFKFLAVQAQTVLKFFLETINVNVYLIVEDKSTIDFRLIIRRREVINN